MEARSSTPGRSPAPDASDAPEGLALILRCTRPQYIPTSVLPGVAGGMVALGSGEATWGLLAVAVLALFCVHAGVNVINDVEDADRGVDDASKMDNSRVFTTGLMSIPDGRRLSAGFFAAAFVLGTLIAIVQAEPWLFAIGIAGIVGGAGYSYGPRPLKYAGLGDIAIIFLMGPLLTQGAYTAVTGDAFHAPAFWIGLAPGLLIAAVLQANNLSDIRGDRAAGVRTLAVRLGFGVARALYFGSLLLAYATVVTLVAVGLFDWPLLLVLLTLPVAAQRVQQALAVDAEGDERLVDLAARTAQLHLLFNVLLIAGVILAEA